MKTKQINFRLNENTLNELKEKSSSVGISYTDYLKFMILKEQHGESFIINTIKKQQQNKATKEIFKNMYLIQNQLETIYKNIDNDFTIKMKLEELEELIFFLLLGENYGS